MEMVLPAENDERKIHLNAIEVLAKELDKAIWEVDLIYRSILEDLQKQARVKIFLHILVSKKVREIMKH